MARRATGQPDLTRPVYTWITARMVHVRARSSTRTIRRRRSGRAGVGGLAGRLRDSASGGWLSSIDAAGESPDEKACYTHAFVVLAASSGAVAGLSGALRDLLTEALDIWDQQFFDDAGNVRRLLEPRLHPPRRLPRSQWQYARGRSLVGRCGCDRGSWVGARVLWESLAGWRWSSPSRTPGGSPNTSLRAGSHSSSTTGIAPTTSSSRMGPRSDTAWNGRDCCCIWRPPWGTGCSLAAEALFDRAVVDGWAVDGADGFIYTTDWDGTPVVRDRMHWVVAEAIAAAAALRRRTGDDRYSDLAATWWGTPSATCSIGRTAPGTISLDATNHVIETVWPGKPDLYHAVQATVIPRPLGAKHGNGSGPGSVKRLCAVEIACSG